MGREVGLRTVGRATKVIPGFGGLLPPVGERMFGRVLEPPEEGDKP